MSEDAVQKAPREWAAEQDVWIRNWNGWTVHHLGLPPKDPDEPVTEAEFKARLGHCTVER